MNSRKRIGNYGEQKAVEFLEKNGYLIIERNFTCRQGEIDIIATKNEEIIFIEVKTRSSLTFGVPCESVTSIKQKHIFKSARYYLHLHHMENCFVRFDVVKVYLQGKNCKINHIMQIV